MVAGESIPPMPPSTQAPSPQRKTLVLVLVAILVVAALAGVTYVLLSRGQQPPTTPPAIVLDHVTITGGNSVDQAASVILSAAAIDTKGVDQTAAAQWLWTANPAGSVDITAAGAPSSARIFGKVAGSVTITANATWNSSAKQTSQGISVNALHYDLVPSQIAPLVRDNFTLLVRVLRGTTLATSYQGTIHFTSDDPGASLPGDYAFALSDAGARSFDSVNITRAGAVTISASDTAVAITGSTTVNGNRRPSALFTITPNPANPLLIQADASMSSDPDNDPLAYAWEFGDSGISSSQVATHTYARAGTYLVNLTVTDSHAASNTTQKFYLAKSPPTAEFTFSLSQAGPDIRIAVDASRSTDADGTIVNYNWTWGDGNYSDVSTPTTTHDYAPFWHDKDVTIVLVTSDNDALTGTMSQTLRITLQNLPPVACFTVGLPIDQINRIVDVDASCSTDPNGPGDIAWYNWTWDDGSWFNDTVPTASHQYLMDGMFVINLTVGDSGNLKGYAEMPVDINQPDVSPTAILAVMRELMHVDADASQSSDANGDIVSYTFDWGDGVVTGPQTSQLAIHDYNTPNSYSITLTVTDAGGRTGTDAKTISVARSTLDYRYDDFFNVSYGEWWDWRFATYGDLPIDADCFNETAIADGVCTASATNGIDDFETYPYTNWYPLPGQTHPGNPTNNPLVYAPYRFSVQGVNVSGYNRSEPVFLPVLNYNAAPGNQLDFQWYMNYLDYATGSLVTSRGCSGVDPTRPGYDGFMIRSQVWVTMDLQESRRIFGVIAPGANLPQQVTAARNWWASNTNNACGTEVGVESSVSSWFETLGGPSGSTGKYDIVNSFEYQYTPFYTNMTYIVEDDGTTRVYLEHAAWGTEVLLARMFYWGNASYEDNHLDSRKAMGWWGMELAWFEDFDFSGSLLADNFDFNLSSVMQYHWQLLSQPGPDGNWNRVNDVPYWTWGPVLTDYTNDYSPKHLVSELDRYPTPYYGYIHTTPGSARYNQNLSYDYAPIRWNLQPGQTWHFEFPTGNVIFYDPNTTPLGADPRTGAFTAIRKTLVYDSTVPPGLGAWDDARKTWDVYGPTSTGGPSGNPGPDNTPGTSDDQYALFSYGSLVLTPGVQLALRASLSRSGTLLGSSVPPQVGPGLVVPFDGATAGDIVAAPSVGVSGRTRWE